MSWFRKKGHGPTAGGGGAGTPSLAEIRALQDEFTNGIASNSASEAQLTTLLLAIVRGLHASAHET